MTRRRLLVAAATALALLAPLLLDRLFPPDMGRYRDASVEVQDRSGRLLRAYLSGDHAWRLATGPEDVDPRYLRLLLAYEDKRFDLHPGVDPLAIARAVGQWLTAGRPVSGGSTITMQAVRLLEPRPRTLRSKLIEVVRAAQLEWRYSKRDILGIYLTLAPFGGNLEGVRAAALSYFGKEPAHLTDAQAALLVALPQSPTRRRPDRHPAAARAAQLRVIDRLAGAGALTAQAVAEAREDAGRQALARRPFPRAAEHLADRLKASSPPGAVLRSSLAGGLQATAESLLRREAAWLRDGAAIAALVIENADAKVRAYVGGQDYFGPAGMLDLARAQRSPGSTLKPFIYALGFDDRIVHPETQILDRPTQFGGYAPANFDGRFHGLVTIREALQGSLNVPAVAVLDRVGPQRLASMLRDAGASLAFPETGTPPSLALALGGVGISLSDMAMLYRGLASGGIVRPLSFLEVAPEGMAGHRLASPRAAWLVGDILRGTPVPDTVAHATAVDRREIAYKTGTSYGYRDAWAVGWSASYTVAVWVGRSDGTPRAGVLGRDAAAP
ncbi:MAG: penicillin-binding protein 1C, partial [Alphaproteobacteria bacterium]